MMRKRARAGLAWSQGPMRYESEGSGGAGDLGRRSSQLEPARGSVYQGERPGCGSE